VDPTYDGDAESYRDTIRAFLAEHLPAGWQGIGALGEEEREQFCWPIITSSRCRGRRSTAERV
jgi:hypothetical protein